MDMKLGRRVVAVSTAVGIGGAGLVGVATVAQASVLDREQKRCGSAMVTAKLERDSREHEVDVEVYSQRGGERWRIVIKDGDGDVLRTVNRSTNREGEFWLWRSIPGSINEVSIDMRGPNGQRCTLTLQA
jgi:hypothetical protein